MQLSLEDASERWLLLAVSSLLAAILIFQASEIWVATRRIQSGHLDVMERGAELLPRNGEAWDRVGRFWQLDFANADSSIAVSAYEKAVRDDPNSSYYWMDLASAYEDAGDLTRAQQAFERAKAVYPMSALVAWNYGNFLVRRGDDSEGYQEIHKAVATDQKLIPLAISRTWRSSEDVHVLLDYAIPATTDAYLQALDFFTQIHQADAALTVWKRLVALGRPLALSDAFALLDTLIRLDRPEDALRVWREALAGAEISNDGYAGQSLIWNGDFSRDFANGGLDWRWSAPLGAAAAIDSAPPSKPGRSLRLEFSGGVNIALDVPAQFVPVQPGHSYHFQAYLRTEEITTDRGVQFLLADPNHPGAVNALTDSFTGSHPWTAVDADLTSGPETHFLVVRLVRSPSRMFENKLDGTAWIADISLVPSGQTSHAAP
jgi:tetratricopeptide (TPR) repeat protein